MLHHTNFSSKIFYFKCWHMGFDQKTFNAEKRQNAEGGKFILEKHEAII